MARLQAHTCYSASMRGAAARLHVVLQRLAVHACVVHALTGTYSMQQEGEASDFTADGQGYFLADAGTSPGITYVGIAERALRL